MLPISWTGGPAELFLAWLWRSSWQAGVVALVVLLLRAMLGERCAPRWRYGMWALVLLRLLILSAPESRFSLFGLGSVLRDAAVRRQTARIDTQRLPIVAGAENHEISIRVGVLPMERPVLGPVAAPAPVAPPSPVNGLPLASILLGIWFAGVLLVLVRLAIANVTFVGRVARTARPADQSLRALLDECRRKMRLAQPLALVNTDAVDSPALMGLLRPRLLLPETMPGDLSPAQLRLVFLHELSHLKCRDIAIDWLWAILLSLHWFNPVLWLARRRCRADRELARDAMVLAIAGSTEAESYGQTILRLVAAAHIRPLNFCPGILGIVDARADLRRRIAMIARIDARRRRHSWLGFTLVLMAGCVTLTNPKGQSSRAAQPTSPTTSAVERVDSTTVGTTLPAVPPDGRVLRDQTPRTQPAAVQTVADLIKKARELAANGQYHEAIAVVDQILILEPRNDYAIGVRPLLEDKESRSQQGQTQLDRKLPQVEFNSVGLSDVVDFLRDVSGANIFVNWKALEDGGIDKNAPVTARLFNVKFSKALQAILESVSTQKTKVSYFVDDGVITISCGDDLNRNLTTRVYDIRDLIETIPDFTAPAFGVVPDVSPATQPATAQTRRTREQLINDVMALIKATVAADSWGKAGRIKQVAGQLVITQTPENHAQIVQLLDQLRETRGIQVTLAARFLVVDKTTATKFGLEATPAADQKKPGTSAGVYLSTEKVAGLLHDVQQGPGMKLLPSPRITCFNGQQAYVLASTSTAYISGYKADKDNDGQTTWEPITSEVDAGLLLELQPFVSADRKFATLKLHPALSRLDRIESVPYSESPPEKKLFIQRPVMTIRELRTTANISNGETLVLGGFAEQGDKPSTQPGKSVPQTQPNAATDDILGKLGPDRMLFLLVTPTIIMDKQVEDKKFPVLQSKPASP